MDRIRAIHAGVGPRISVMYVFALLSALVTLAAAFSLISHRLLRLPTTVGVMLLSLVVSTPLVLLAGSIPAVHAKAAGLISHIDFSVVVLHGMLAFLLFAGAMQLNVGELRRQKAPVAALSIFGTIVSALLVGFAIKGILRATGLELGFLPCFLFGALISPTDPIAVVEMMRRVGAPASLEAQLSGESLFNDGVGAVLFLTLLASFDTGQSFTFGAFSWHLLVKAGGGIGLGLALGYIAYTLLRTVDAYRVEELLTLALAMGGYALADVLGLSAPLEVVAAGLVAGSVAREMAMSELTGERVDRFWELIDDMLNVMLFLLLGLELLVMPWHLHYIYAGLLAIPVVLGVRWISVVVSLLLVRVLHRPARGAITVLTWGGLRGALAVALALSIKPGPAHDRLLAITYIVVIFSIVAQGLTMDRLLRRLGFAEKPEAVVAD